MDVLCVAAHPDDEVLGVGGTLARHAADGDAVHVCLLSGGVASRYDGGGTADDARRERRRHAERACSALGATVSFHDFPDNQFDSVPLLDIVQTVEGEVDEHAPDIVYTHHYGDLNVDHELACRATVTATRPLPDSGVRRVFGFETLSASEWAVRDPSNAFQPTTFVDVSASLDRKLEALRSYESELRELPHPRNPETVRRNAQVWGAKAGVDAAEPFELLRAVRRSDEAE